MFEKEAEEYVCKRNPLVTKEWFIDAFKKYNKGEKVKYLKDCEIAEYEAYIVGAEFGYNKANEWHFVKDGDLPEDNKIVLFYTTYFDFWVGGIEPKNDKKHRWGVLPSVSGDYYAEDEVIAWKEIVLPELKESE